uniref:peptidylamidoglycolate lyase n=1 Tax=Drosophila melanogaster TaxID=7227 RepID=A0A0B4LF14_DROME|nr:Peptidyl-alpha-hydroxyglycine-alpha-amidating lyase 1, isoform C [Drosophila melanogaster]AHN56057.1 Peptidyl-alpha-hydroxyglycine-alpha-amidating lyase 1, isoform C [Drosophila melanogaster]|eukprot:NP_001286259.1 Peptidyl-alpha-hydroxyglycine-alpha-amidating lyase 1, isoform C [Drosophila melanogaster]
MKSTDSAKCLGSKSLAICCLLLHLLLCIRPAVSQTQSPQRYLHNVDSNSNNNERLHQILKGSGAGSGATQLNWPQPPKQTVPNVKTELAKLNNTYVYQNAWPANNVKLGAVTAVSFDKAGNVVIFHRVNRVWGQTTFDNRNQYQEKYRGPIRESTILALEPATGKVQYDWGKNFFYMPHGLTVDPEDNVWLTDVAMHQVFKFPPRGGDGKPALTLGDAFQPGSGRKFCKPTSVAVLDNGDFFVADGYCNARILKYSRKGELILFWGQNTFSGISYDVAPQNFFAIPHALTLVPELQLLCAADRENGRVQCFLSSNGTFHSQYHNQLIGDRLFSMAYTPAAGGQLVIVNGPTAELGIHPEHYNEVHGFVLSMRSKQLVSKFGPNNLQFQNPHDVAVTADGNEIYVAELNPMRIHKFVHRSLAKPMSLSASKDSRDSAISQAVGGDQVPAVAVHHPSGKAILVASLMLLFAGSTFALALIFARRRKRGNQANSSATPSDLVYRKLTASTQSLG